MKQFHVETKNQKTGEWMLAHRIKCHYRFGYVSKQWHWPLDCREFSKLAVVDQDGAEARALARAMHHAVYLARSRRLAGTPLLVSIKTRIVRLDFIAFRSDVRRTVVWKSEESDGKVKCNGTHSA